MNDDFYAPTAGKKLYRESEWKWREVSATVILFLRHSQCIKHGECQPRPNALSFEMKIYKNCTHDCEMEAFLKAVLRMAAVPSFHGNFLVSQWGLHKERNCLITGLFTPAQPLPVAILSQHQTLLQWQSFQRHLQKYLAPHNPRPEGHGECSVSQPRRAPRHICCLTIRLPYWSLSVWRCCG